MNRKWNWIPSYKDSFPINAVQAGVDESGNKIYVARATHEKCLTPGKFCVRNRIASIPWVWDGQEYEKSSYEILVAAPGILTWENYDYRLDGLVPWKALRGGISKVFDEPLYIGRFQFRGLWLLGFYQSSRKSCYATYDGNVIVAKHDIQILCES